VLNPAVFKAYDVRGLYPSELDEEGAYAVGQAYVELFEPRVIAVGHDMRESGPELAAAFAEGVRREGVDVVHIGLASTDMIYFAAGRFDSPGAMLTASHNPAAYNGIKLCLAGAAPVGVDSGLPEIKQTTAQLLADRDRRPLTGKESSVDLLDDFVAHVHSFIDVGALRHMKVVADTANGMGGLTVPRVFEKLPIDLDVLYPELDGTFPNHPADPIQPENQRDLRSRVAAIHADVGLAFDGDADRVFLVDEQGRGLSGSTTTAMLAVRILDKNPGAKIIHNLICSKAVPEVIREHGGEPIRTRVGHSFIKQVMAETGAVFGGEHSAHYYFRDNFRADSGIIATMFVLELMSITGKPLSELRVPLERYADSGEINTHVADPAAVIERVARHYGAAQQDRLDGLTVDFGEWWFNLRPSNTEPLLRLNLEAATREECDARVAEVLALVTGG